MDQRAAAQLRTAELDHDVSGLEIAAVDEVLAGDAEARRQADDAGQYIDRLTRAEPNELAGTIYTLRISDANSRGVTVNDGRRRTGSSACGRRGHVLATPVQCTDDEGRQANHEPKLLQHVFHFTSRGAEGASFSLLSAGRRCN